MFYSFLWCIKECWLEINEALNQNLIEPSVTVADSGHHVATVYPVTEGVLHPFCSILNQSVMSCHAGVGVHIGGV